MADNDRSETAPEFSFTGTTGTDLRGKQSVRATFRLSQQAINAISTIAVHMGIKQKSLFDHLIEDLEALHIIAQEMGDYQLKQRDRLQKTFVISRKTLSNLEQVCRESGTPRDVIVEFSVKRLMPLIEREKRRHEARKSILDDFAEYLLKGRQILARASESLGEDDPVFNKIRNTVTVGESAYRDIRTFVERGRGIEDF